ncbi:hypothetical protein LINGRAHAP2_LOCUS9337 [Linum grandiflorum]
MEVLQEEEEYNWKEVKLPSLIPKVPEPELEREKGERRRGRDIIVAVDHGPNSKHAFDWALIHFSRLADTLHLVHAVSSVKNDIVDEMTQTLMEKLAVEAFQVSMVKSVARIVQGDAGKVICKEAERIKPAAVVMGTRGRSLVQRRTNRDRGMEDPHCKKREKQPAKALGTVEEDEVYDGWNDEAEEESRRMSELDMETAEGRRRRRIVSGRDIIVGIDHGPNSKHAFNWALLHLCRQADTLHLVHALSDAKNTLLSDMAEGLVEKYTLEALRMAKVKAVGRIVEGDASKVICKEAERLNPVAVVLGTRGRSLFQCVVQGSVGEYCFHHIKVPVIIVPLQCLCLT